MWENYGEAVQFYVVYIREAHAIDSAVALGGEEDSGLGGGENPIMEDAVTFEEREAAATTRVTPGQFFMVAALVHLVW